TAILRDACKRFEISPDRIALGGLGEGGILALQFTQECWSAPMLYPYRPRSLFCLDTPVDLTAWWKQAETDLKRNLSAETVAKAHWTQQALKKEIGGAPDTLQTAYRNRSPFTADRPDQGK
ncbi:hypothetical protein RZS08_52620, partial [Arthrospira platensis SPKY1]|nr:hypothetical protein [Arthrospira platensis SPKY1]